MRNVFDARIENKESDYLKALAALKNYVADQPQAETGPINKYETVYDLKTNRYIRYETLPNNQIRAESWSAQEGELGYPEAPSNVNVFAYNFKQAVDQFSHQSVILDVGYSVEPYRANRFVELWNDWYCTVSWELQRAGLGVMYACATITCYYTPHVSLGLTMVFLMGLLGYLQTKHVLNGWEND